ncbi:MAG: hypothetical protein EXR72_13655 [Myxococcales bacterium]|nr:hypothetical protein [Myxococcales bacterium]
MTWHVAGRPFHVVGRQRARLRLRLRLRLREEPGTNGAPSAVKLPPFADGWQRRPKARRIFSWRHR